MENKELLEANNLKNEEWRDIKGYDGRYQVSNYGRVRSLRLNKINGKFKTLIIKPSSRKGYLLYGLSKNGKTKTYSAHRLVALSFIENPNGYDQINHKNGIKNDNRVINLEWCNGSMNIRHAYDNNLINKKQPIFNKGNKFRKVIVKNENNDIVHVFDNMSVASKYMGINVGKLRSHLIKYKKAKISVVFECEFEDEQ